MLADTNPKSVELFQLHILSMNFFNDSSYSVQLSKMAEKLCLQWSDFQDNVKNAFGHLQDTTDFVDVTLACEDGQHIEAHKVILAHIDAEHASREN